MLILLISNLGMYGVLRSSPQFRDGSDLPCSLHMPKKAGLTGILYPPSALAMVVEDHG